MDYNINFYQSLAEFQNNFEDDYYIEHSQENPKLSYLQYLKDLYELYDLKSEILNNQQQYTKDFKNNKLKKEDYDDLIKLEFKLLLEYNKIRRFIEKKIVRAELSAEAKTKPERKLTNPEKIAVLYLTGTEETLKKMPIAEDKYRYIHTLIGGDYDNIKKTVIKGLTNENIRVAKEFIYSKTH